MRAAVVADAAEKINLSLDAGKPLSALGYALTAISSLILPASTFAVQSGVQAATAASAGDGQGVKRALAAAVSGVVGAAGFAWGGAKIGAMLGGPPGMLIGAGLGFLGGYFGGTAAASGAAEAVDSKGMGFWQGAWKGITESADALWHIRSNVSGIFERLTKTADAPLPAAPQTAPDAKSKAPGEGETPVPVSNADAINRWAEALKPSANENTGGKEAAALPRPAPALLKTYTTPDEQKPVKQDTRIATAPSLTPNA
jgi:hypothetical protein